MNNGRLPEGWRNHSTKHPIAACRLKRGDLKRLYKLINDKQVEYRDRFLPLLVQQANETAEIFDARRKRVFDSFVTSMTIHASNNELLHGNNDAFLEEENLPDRLMSILFDTGSVPTAIIGFTPPSRIVLFLDFRTQPLLDFSRVPTLPTLNESNYEITADNHSWFAASNATLGAFFKDRRTSVDWLHRANLYDKLLFLIGLPLAIWADYRLSGHLGNAPTLPPIIISAIYIYVFMFALQIFRIFFFYSRWVFPKIELDSPSGSSPLRHRLSWLAVCLSVGAAFIYDVIKSILGSSP